MGPANSTFFPDTLLVLLFISSVIMNDGLSVEKNIRGLIEAPIKDWKKLWLQADEKHPEKFKTALPKVFWLTPLCKIVIWPLTDESNYNHNYNNCLMNLYKWKCLYIWYKRGDSPNEVEFWVR